MGLQQALIMIHRNVQKNETVKHTLEGLSVLLIAGFQKEFLKKMLEMVN